MEETVTEQFNRQQLILAKKIAGDISYHFKFLETSLRAHWFVLAVVHLDPERRGPVIFHKEEPALNKELGIDWDRYFLWGVKPENRGKIIIGQTFRLDIGPFQGRRLMVMAAPAWNLNPLQNSNSEYHFEGISLLVIDPASIAQRYTRDVRSGKTGYAWVIDHAGVFLSHYEETFVGEDSFTVRQKKNPDISYVKINEIVRYDLLQGKEGTGWYISGWHRGTIGTMKKLFAYSPVVLQGTDNGENLWSVGVTAPAAEVYGIVQSLVVRQWAIAGLFQVVIFVGLAAAVYFSLQWSGMLQTKVLEKTAALRRSESKVRLERDKVKEGMDELIRTQELLIRSERFAAIGEAAAYLSHEIKNPLVLIGGFATQMEKSLPEDDKNIQKLRIIKDETSRLELLLTDVRDFTRPSRPRKELLDIHLSIKETLALMETELKERGIECNMLFDDTLPPVWFDPEKIKQVLINLIKNAAEAMSEGGRITIKTQPNGDYTRISITDSGEGMSAETIKKIFDPFFTTKKKGTGLGLAVCRKIIEDHTGELSVESKEGEGTSVTFTLPKMNDKETEGN
jgi:signal transduction histidine kinase